MARQPEGPPEFWASSGAPYKTPLTTPIF